MAELLAPGGGFEAAVRAFENGADAVYLGLSEFSARKSAVNFSMDDLRRLRRFQPDKKLYLALNTLVPDKDLSGAGAILLDARDAGIDAVIVQDAGIANLVRRLTPELALHASTQMAVHNVEGAREVLDEGFTRAVLARECTLKEIREIRRAVPELELEVFVHGALCFGFSGLCQASQFLLGRSANRGECGQICRTWFESEGRAVYPFSQNDLALGGRVRDLASAGVASLKIEGRMKGPQYTASVCRWYRILLDGDDDSAGGTDAGGLGVGTTGGENVFKKRGGKKNGTDTGCGAGCPAEAGGDYREPAEEAALSFSRNQTIGRLDGGKGKDLLNPVYPGPTGLFAGKVLRRDGKGVFLRAGRDLERRDGLLWFTAGAPGAPPEPHKGGLMFRDGKRSSVKKGESAWIDLVNPPKEGEEVRLLSRSGDHPKKVNAASFGLYKTPIGLRISLRENRLHLLGTCFEFSREMSDSAPAEEARAQGRFIPAVEKAFSGSGESDFVCSPVIVESLKSAEMKNGGAAGEPFIPPARLKRIRREFLNDFSKAYGNWKEQRLKAVLREIEEWSGGSDSCAAPAKPTRTMMISPSWLPLPFPAAVSDSDLRASDLPVIGGVSFLPLPPVEFRSGILRERIESLIEEAFGNETRRLCIGLNNPSHVYLARRLAECRPDDIGSGRLSFFLDYGLYTVNRAAWEWYRRRVPGLMFFVESLESEQDGWVRRYAEIPAVRLGEDFPMPLFISRTCPVRHAGLNGNTKIGECPVSCNGNRDFVLTQNGREYRVLMRSCLCYVLSGSVLREESFYRIQKKAEKKEENIPFNS